MKTKLFTRNLKTGDITVTSNVTSVTVNGTRISRVEEIPGHERESPSAIYIDLTVQQPVKLHDVLCDSFSVNKGTCPLNKPRLSGLVPIA
jgi:cell shape-determining protein MreC